MSVVCLQREYGIFGGKAGSHILRLLQHLKMPVVTTLHTVLREPDVDQLIVLQKIAARSDRLIVMSEHSSQFLQDVFRVPAEKIDLIPDGIPDLPFAEPAYYKDSFSTGKTVLLTFGLLSPNKGFESVIQALPRILSRHSNVVYIIAGATHPHVRRREGDRYRLQLRALAKELGVEENVVFTTGSSALKKWLRWLVRQTFSHAVPLRGTGRIRNTRVCLGRREGDHLDA
jgi:glycosyltransferase involved in cell wall biosynthesis